MMRAGNLQGKCEVCGDKIEEEILCNCGCTTRAYCSRCFLIHFIQDLHRRDEDAEAKDD